MALLAIDWEKIHVLYKHPCLSRASTLARAHAQLPHQIRHPNTRMETRRRANIQFNNPPPHPTKEHRRNSVCATLSTDQKAAPVDTQALPVSCARDTSTHTLKAPSRNWPCVEGDSLSRSTTWIPSMILPKTMLVWSRAGFAFGVMVNSNWPPFFVVDNRPAASCCVAHGGLGDLGFRVKGLGLMRRTRRFAMCQTDTTRVREDRKRVREEATGGGREEDSLNHGLPCSCTPMTLHHYETLQPNPKPETRNPKPETRNPTP